MVSTGDARRNTDKHVSWDLNCKAGARGVSADKDSRVNGRWTINDLVQKVRRHVTPIECDMLPEEVVASKFMSKTWLIQPTL